MKAPLPTADRVFRALADGTRLRIVGLLMPGELCVCDIVAILRVPQPTASRHLAYLRRSRLVEVRKHGLWSYYRLARPAGPFHRKLLACLRTCAGDIRPLVADAARRRARRCADACC